MAQTISATDTELQKPVNVILQQQFLRVAQQLCPYFAGSVPADLVKNGGSATAKWRRVEQITPTTTALAELTGTSSYMQGRDSTAMSQTDVTATVSKYGQFVILNEEVDLFLPSATSGQIMRRLAESAGRSLNQLQRNELEDNSTLVYAGSATNDATITSPPTLNDIKQVVNTLARNDARTFTPITSGSQNIGTSPILPSFWGICHPDVASDISGLAGFKSVETYAQQTATVPGEFGTVQSAGYGVRFIQTSDASVDADAGGSASSHGLNGTTDIDLYSTVIFGEDFHGSLGLGMRHTDGIYRAGDDLGAVEIIQHGAGSGGIADPYNEIRTIAWKAWHVPKILNANWGRALRSGATDLAEAA